MTDFQQVADRYIATWNEMEPRARRAAIEALWAEDGRYVDPAAAVRGHDEIDSTIAAVQARFPGFAFRLAGAVDGHHQQCRFAWELGPAESQLAPIAGFDVAMLDADGRLTAVLGFLDRLPPN
jgi:SnoaL-like domain